MNYQTTTCGMCDGRGTIMAPQMTRSPVGGSYRLTNRAFRCSCYSGQRYLGSQLADEEVERHGIEQVQESISKTIEWYRRLGLDFENDDQDVLLDAARAHFRGYATEKLFRNVSQRDPNTECIYAGLKTIRQ